MVTFIWRFTFLILLYKWRYCQMWIIVPELSKYISDTFTLFILSRLLLSFYTLKYSQKVLSGHYPLEFCFKFPIWKNKFAPILFSRKGNQLDDASCECLATTVPSTQFVFKLIWCLLLIAFAIWFSYLIILNCFQSRKAKLPAAGSYACLVSWGCPPWGQH